MTRADDRMTLMEHLSELRKRLFLAALSIVVGMVIAAVLERYVFDLLMHPLPLDHRKLLTLSPSEPFLTSLKIWFYAGLVLAVPMVLYQFWAFIGPAFTSNERKKILPIVFVTTLLFFAGLAFGYLWVLPRALRILLGWNSSYFSTMVRASDYLSFASWFLVAFGAVFEMPAVLVGLVRLGIIDVRFLRKHRRVAIVINAVIAALATPPDAFSMIALFVPLLVLYELTIVVAALMMRRRRRLEAREMAQASGGPPEPPGTGGVTPTPA